MSNAAENITPNSSDEAEKKESFYEMLNVSSALITFTPEGIIQSANALFCAATGYAEHEIIGQHHRIFCDPEYANTLEYKNFWKDLASGKNFQNQYKRYNKNGELLWLDAIYGPVKNAQGKVTGVLKIAKDITQIKKNALMKDLVEKAPLNIMYATPDGVLEYMNTKSKQTLKTIEQHLPDKVENLEGKSVDWFHKNPAVQRKIIGDASNLPHTAVINVGEEKLDLLVSPIVDDNGDYIGPMVTWGIVTTKLQLIQDLTEASENLAASSEEMLSVSQTLSSNAEETSAQSNTASAAAEEINSGIQTVSTNIEEMTASIREITSNTNESSRNAGNAMNVANEANSIIQNLGESSTDIGNVIKVITSIAQQTNLLALNATIEAARAGEAGKGFAVVANEVKELAKQTATATEDISQKIEAIQSDTQSAISSIGQVSEAISSVNDISTSIASAMEEQSATTGEVSRVVSESSQGVQQITENIQQVSIAAEQTGKGAIDMQSAAQSLSDLANTLKQLVERVKNS